MPLSTNAHSLVSDFALELEALSKKYHGDPRGEFLALLFLALEREEIVSVSYRDTILNSTIQSLPVNAEIQLICRAALNWIWKDEQMHTTYVRAVIAREAPARLPILARQGAGSIGGWTSAVLHHATWKSAPISLILAKSMLAIGALMGKVPRGVYTLLSNPTFENFCEFNIDAEETAEMCWARIAELAAALEMPQADTENFARIRRDERNHRQIFLLLRQVRTDTSENLAKHIGAIGESFLPRALRRCDNTVSKVYCVNGAADPETKTKSFQVLLEQSGLAGLVREPHISVAIKAPFMMVYDRADSSPIIDLDLLRALISYLNGLGVKNISLIERGNIYERFAHNRSVAEVAAYLGVDRLPVNIVDAGADQVEHAYSRGLGLPSVCRTWRDADVRITMGKLRSHPIDHVLLTLANMEGLGPRWDDFLFFERSLDFAAAQAAMEAEFPAQFAVLDANINTPDGMIGVMGNPGAHSVGRFYASVDALALDEVALRHLSVRLEDCTHVREAKYWRGDCDNKIDVIGVDEKIQHWRGPHSNDFCGLLSLLSVFIYEYTGRGQLFVPKFDAHAFPLLHPPHFILRILRAFILKVLSLQFGRRR